MRRRGGARCRSTCRRRLRRGGRSGSRPIEGVGTAVAAFVGLAEQGPFNAPTLVSNWTQFTTTFGEFAAGTYLAHAVYGYFMNGGGNCYIVRIGDGGSSRRRGRARSGRPAGGPGQRYAPSRSTAPRPGEIEVEIAAAGGDTPTDDMFKLIVKRGGQHVEEFDRVTTNRGRQNVATWSTPSPR